MRVAVMGAGAIGCYYGGMMARAGHDVVFIGRPVHVDAINATGLVVETADFKATVPARAAVDTASLAAPDHSPGLMPDLWLVCVKSADTEAAGRDIAGALRPDTAILCLQNGVDNAERLAKEIGYPTISAVVYVGTEMAGPGHVRHHGGGRLVIGPSDASPDLARALEAAGIPTTIDADIDAALWGKLIVNCAYNAMSAVGSIPYGAMITVPGARDLMTAVVTECVAVANALGVTLPADTLEKTLAIATVMPAQFSSTAQDLARGKPTEIDYLNGHVVKKGAALGIATPTNLALQVMVKLAERGRELAKG